MKCLLLDTSTSYVTVSIIENDNILYNFYDKILSDTASKILPIIDSGLNEVNLSLNDIDKLFIVNGPGSFTGIRVGVTIAKTIAWALNKPIIPISSLELLATTKTDKLYKVPMIDARRENVFAAIYDNNLNNIKEEKLVNLNELLDTLDSDYQLISYDVETNGILEPNLDIIKIINKHKNDKGVNAHSLNPNYLKLTEAEESREKKYKDD